MRTRTLWLLAVLTACGSHAAEVAPSAWRCFVLDPKQPHNPAGDVTHTRHRLAAGHLQIETVWLQGDRGGATRLDLQPVGDHLEGTMAGATVTVRLGTPDATQWTLSYRDPSSDFTFSEDTRIDATGKTIVSTDPSDRGPVQTSIHYINAPCATVEAALAKYP